MDSFPPSLPSEPGSAEEIHRLIGEVAKRHRIILAPGDPLFVMLTLLELVTGRYLEKADAILKAERESSL